MAQQLINEGVYRLSAKGLYLTAALFGFHECDRVVLTDKTRDLNQAWRLHHVEKNGWQLINLAAEMYLSNRIGYQYDDEPFVISKVNYGGRNIFFLEEAEGGYRLRRPGRRGAGAQRLRPEGGDSGNASRHGPERRGSRAVLRPAGPAAP